VASGLYWNAVRFISDLDSNGLFVWSFKRTDRCFCAKVKVGRSNSLLRIRHWMGSDLQRAVAERNRAYEI
jgi:hypothetical protein